MGAVKFRDSWGIDFCFKRERIRKTSPDNSKAGAKAYEAVIRYRLAKGESVKEIFNAIPKEVEQTFETFAWHWFDIYVQPNNKFSEQQRKKRCLNANLLPFFGSTPLEKISTYQIEQYKAHETHQGMHPKTINNHLSVLSSCLNKAEEWEIIVRVPKIKKLKTPPQKIEFLSQREADLLLENSSGIGHLLILTALKTGLRLGELIGLSWTDVNFSNKTLTVRRSWCRYKKELVSPKSNKERTVPLTDTLHDALFEARRVEGPVFINERGRRISGRTIRLEIRRACERSGIRVVGCHKLRHTFASHLAMAGAPIPSIQQLMGHSDIKTTMLYAHLSESTLRSAVGLLDGVVKSPFMKYVNIASTTEDE